MAIMIRGFMIITIAFSFSARLPQACLKGLKQVGHIRAKPIPFPALVIAEHSAKGWVWPRRYTSLRAARSA
eukprot:8607529-Pyramimonas_sp.AAC.1